MVNVLSRVSPASLHASYSPTHPPCAPACRHLRNPVLLQIPVIGPVLFNQNVLVYLMYFVVGLIWFALNKTKWGLRTRGR